MKNEVDNWWIVVGLAGVLGALSRWAVSLLLEQSLSVTSYVTTSLVNVLGCALMGAVLGIGKQISTDLNQYVEHIATGFVGSFTTFSTLMFDIYSLVSVLNPAFTFLLIMAQTVVGLVAYKASSRVTFLSMQSIFRRNETDTGGADTAS